MRLLTAALLLSSSAALISALPGKCKPKPQVPDCKCMPGDSCWPNAGQWNALSKQVKGKLEAASAPASVCHDPTYDEVKCKALQAEWPNADFFLDKPFSPHNLRYTNYTCSPWTPREQPCTLDGYAAYSIRVESEKDIQVGIKFAEKHNIRLVIRNTGHDFLGKSSGAGSLILYTHPLQSIELIEDFSGPTYSGPALKVGAGVTVRDAYKFAGEHGLEVVGGECPSVGLAGGYIQGGGHGPLSGIHGMGADQALSYDVVLADGSFVTATPTGEYKDLYWALSGGGAGTYGVVTSVTIKAFESRSVTGVQLTVPIPLTEKAKFYELIDFYHSEVTKYTSKGIYSYPLYGTFGPSYMFMLQPFFAPGLSKSEVDDLLAPLREKITELGFVAVLDTTETYPSFWDSFEPLFPNERSSNTNAGGRLIPTEDLENNKEAIDQAIHTILEGGALAVEFAVNPNLEVAGNPDNSVNPVWRKTQIHFITAINYPDNASPADVEEVNSKITDIFNPALESAAPNGGQYGNEGDVNEPNWQKNFYGIHYDRLLQIKRKYDPKDLFWAQTAVGSEGQFLEGGVGGRLCRVK